MRLADAGLIGDGVARGAGGLARAGAARGERATGRGAATLIDVPVFGEIGLLRGAPRRGRQARGVRRPAASRAAARRRRRASTCSTVTRTPTGTRRALRPDGAARPLPARRRARQRAAAEDRRRQRSIPAIPAASIATPSCSTVDGPPAGIVSVGGYRFALRAVQDLIGGIEDGSTLAALPDMLAGHRLAGAGADRDAICDALLGPWRQPLAGCGVPRPEIATRRHRLLNPARTNCAGAAFVDASFTRASVGSRRILYRAAYRPWRCRDRSRRCRRGQSMVREALTRGGKSPGAPGRARRCRRGHRQDQALGRRAGRLMPTPDIAARRSPKRSTKLRRPASFRCSRWCRTMRPRSQTLYQFRPTRCRSRLVPRLRAALRVRALHATVLRRAEELAERPTRRTPPDNDPIEDATVLVAGRGRNYPALTVAVGERMGLIGALSHRDRAQLSRRARHRRRGDRRRLQPLDRRGFRRGACRRPALARPAGDRAARCARDLDPERMPNADQVSGDPQAIAAHILPFARHACFRGAAEARHRLARPEGRARARYRPADARRLHGRARIAPPARRGARRGPFARAALLRLLR